MLARCGPAARSDLDRIIEAAVEQPERRIIVDLAAQTHQFLTRWMEDSGVKNWLHKAYGEFGRLAP